MDDAIYSEVKQRQQRWMREREVSIANGGVDVEDVGDLVNKLADRIAETRQEKGREPLPKSVADEIDANTCSICLETMLPPHNSPVILFPCGHTICKTCVTTIEKKHMNKVCPCCKAKVTSTAINYSLQSVIAAHAASKTRPTASKPLESQPVGNLTLRLNILHEECLDKKEEIHNIQENIEIAETVIEKLRSEEIETMERLRLLQKELSFVRSSIEKQEDYVSSLKEKKAKTEQAVRLIVATIEPLELELEKAQWIR
mmetsp:Transcript_32782/g.57039  ORF Transcript_32782/g.57039 Transcript_32782/m.57039 type:complete len:258 (+) Transcript_32782:5776-6549(+)